MPDPTYTVILTEAERTAMAKVLGALVTKLINAPVFVESPSGGTASARAVLSPPSPPAAALATPQTPTPIEQRDRWAKDKHGNEVTWPTGAEVREVTIWKTEQKPPRTEGGKPYLTVTWQAKERGYVDANCFDKTLFPWLIKQTGQPTTIYLTTSGRYLNVVGVRA